MIFDFTSTKNLEQLQLRSGPLDNIFSVFNVFGFERHTYTSNILTPCLTWVFFVVTFRSNKMLREGWKNTKTTDTQQLRHDVMQGWKH